MSRVPMPVFCDSPPEPEKYRNKQAYRRGARSKSPRGESCQLEIASALSKLDADVCEEKESIDNEISSLRLRLEYQEKLNGELKRFLIASMGDQFYNKLTCVAEEKARLALDIVRFTKSLENAHENSQHLTIQCEVWKSKYLASCMVLDKVRLSTNSLLGRLEHAKGIIEKLLDETDQCYEYLTGTCFMLERLNALRNPEMRLINEGDQNFTLKSLAATCRTMADALMLSYGCLGVVGNARKLPRIFTPPERDARQMMEEGDVDKSLCSNLSHAIDTLCEAAQSHGCLQSCVKCKGPLKTV